MLGNNSERRAKDLETIEISSGFPGACGTRRKDGAFRGFPIERARADVVVRKRRFRGDPLTRDARKSRGCPEGNADARETGTAID